MGDEVNRLTAAELSNKLRAGQLSIEQLARDCLDRIASRDADVRAWSNVDAARESRSGGVDLLTPVSAPDDAENLGVHQVWRRLVGILLEVPTDAFRVRAREHDLGQA